MISKDFETMLYLYGSASRGVPYKADNDIDVDRIYKLSREQEIWHTVYLALHNTDGAKKYNGEFLFAYQKNLKRNEFVFNTVEKLEENNIQCCIMKGMVVASLYKEPLCRISGDTDILIKEDDEKKSMKVLSQIGYTVYERGLNSHHYVATHPIGGILEVHVKMYSDPTKDILFNDRLRYDEELIEMNISGHTVRTFGITDNAVYLTAHYIKHFISKGVGIRQLMDLLLYIEKYKDSIDWDRYNRIFEELRYTELIRALYAIGNKYFGFSFDVSNDLYIEQILEDTEKGGVFGQNNNDVDKFYDAFTKCRTTMEEKEYQKYMYKKKNASFIRRIFPTKTTMQKNGYEVKNNFELILGYFKRWYDISVAILLKKRNVKSMVKYEVTDGSNNEKIQKRLELMKDLNII